MRTVVVLAALFPSLVFAGACKKSAGELKTIDVAADAMGDPSHPATVRIHVDHADLHLTPGGAHLVGGAVRSNVSDLDPRVDAAADHATVTQGDPASEVSWSVDYVADWRLTLGPTPMALVVENGSGTTDLDLGGLAVRSLRVRAGAGTIHAGWSSPGTLTADALDLETGAGTIEAVNVGRLGASKIRVHSGAGTIKLDFGDKVERDVSVDLESGAGAITVMVPSSVTARATAEHGIGAVSAKGWTADGDAFLLGPAGAPPRVTVRAKAAVGAVSFVAGP